MLMRPRGTAIIAGNGGALPANGSPCGQGNRGATGRMEPMSRASRTGMRRRAPAGLLLGLAVLAAAVIGGTSLFGGRGKIYQALLGALVIGSVENGLDLLGQPTSVKNIATGVILVIAVGIDALSRRRRRAN